jgi:hypothetical protein
VPSGAGAPAGKTSDYRSGHCGIEPLMQSLDDRATMENVNGEMRDFARVLKAALIMIVRYLERRYNV